MSGRALLLLTLLALAQASYLLVARQAPLAADPSRVLQGLTAPQITRLVLTQRGQLPTALERRQDLWRVVSPVDAPADQELVDQILAELEFLAPLRELAFDTPLAKLGLQQPRLQLELRGRGGALRALRLGDRDPSGQGAYLAAGDRLLVVASASGDKLDQDLFALRSKRPLALPVSSIERLEAGHGERRLVLKKERGRWLAAQGGQQVWLAQEARVELFRALQQLAPTRFVDPHAPLPTEEILLVAADQRQTLRWGQACPGAADGELVAWQAGSWQLACFFRADLAPLRRSLAELWDRQLLQATEPALAAIRLASGSEQVELRREGARWQLAAGEPADEVTLRGWLEELRQLRGRPATPLPGRAPEGGWLLELTFEDGQRQIFRFGAPQGQTLALRRSGETASLLVSAAVVPLLAPDPLRFHSRQVLGISAAHLQRVITRRGGQEEVVARSEQGSGWEVLAPVAVAADVEHMARLTQLLARLRAERFVKGAGLRPTAQLTLQLGAEPLQPEEKATAGGQNKPRAASGQRVRLELGADPDPTRCRGRISGGRPFVLDSPSCQLLLARRAARQLDLPPAERLTAISLHSAEGQLALERQGYRWSGQAGEVSAAQVADLLRALAELEVQEVAGYGSPSESARWTVLLSERGQPPRELRLLADGRCTLQGRELIYRLSMSSFSRLLTAFTALGAK